MRDAIDASLTTFGLLWRVIAVIAAIALLPMIVCAGGEEIHAYRHPAPLGRTADEMRAHIDRVLPPGTTLDSASRYLRSLGERTEVYDSVEAQQSFRDDPLLAGGPVILTVHVDTGGLFTSPFEGWLGVVTLYFTPAGRLARREAYVSVRDPL